MEAQTGCWVLLSLFRDTFSRDDLRTARLPQTSRDHRRDSPAYLEISIPRDAIRAFEGMPAPEARRSGRSREINPRENSPGQDRGGGQGGERGGKGRGRA